MLGKRLTSYRHLPTHDLDNDDEAPWLLALPEQQRNCISTRQIAQWIGLSVLCIYSIAITAAYTRQQRHSSYLTGFPTEFAPATSIIRLQKQQFSGDLHFHPNGSSYLRKLDYSGPPRAEIDEHWEELIGKRYFYMSEEEAEDAWGEAYDGYYEVVDGEKKYVGGLDIFHTLHCVNQLRKLLDPGYYRDTVHMSQNHNYHCIDQIRQYLMCYGDLTPVQTHWNTGKGRLYVKSSMMHTCRDFSVAQAYIAGRQIVYG